jgi:hypothetical protein
MGPLKIIRGDKVLLRYQLLADGAPKKISAIKFFLHVRETGMLPLIKSGFIEDADRGKFSFLITETERPFKGRMEIFIRERSGEEIMLTPPGGYEIEILAEKEEALI